MNDAYASHIFAVTTLVSMLTMPLVVKLFTWAAESFEESFPSVRRAVFLFLGERKTWHMVTPTGKNIRFSRKIYDFHENRLTFP